KKKSARHRISTPGASRLSAASVAWGNLRLRLGVLDPQVIAHRAEAESGGRCPHKSYVLFHLVIHHAFERHLPIVHDDVNRRNGLNGVTRKNRIAIDGS